MTSPILVTGGTGTLGRLIVATPAGSWPRAYECSAGAAVQQRTASSSSPATWPRARESRPRWRGPRSSCTAQAARRATRTRPGTWYGRHHGRGRRIWCTSRSSVPTAIPIGSRVDRAMFGYFGSKLAAERIVADSGLPFTMLRATQFHDLILTVAQQMAKLPVVPLPAGFRVQPVDADEVAARLVELALGEPAGRVPDMGGPRVYGAAELLRVYLRASHRRRLIVPIWLPGKAARVFRTGANLAPEQAVGRRTWEEFLAERLS